VTRNRQIGFSAVTRNDLNEIAPAKQNRVNKKHAGGMPRFVPTDEQRNVVERAAGFGLPQVYICQLIVSERTGKPISLETLESAFRAELDRGMALAHYQVANALYEQAVGGNVTAAIWWTKAHMGWSEKTTSHENLISKYDRMSEKELIESLQREANELGIKIDLSYRIPGEDAA